MRIVFMGTPEFSVPGLKKLVEAKKEIVGVITAPDKPSGRGKKVRSSAVKQYAESEGLKVLQPTNLKNEEFLKELKDLQADLFIVVAFRMLPREVWQMPPLGTFNLHGSLLPDYRGAAPIHWAVINGDAKTGLTTFFLKHEIDTGDIILQEEEPISKEDTTGTVYVRLMQKGADLILKTVNLIENDEVSLKPQNFTEQQRSAPKLTKENTEIDWNQDSEVLVNLVRGLNPFPSAWCYINDNYYKIHELASSELGEKALQPGETKIEGNKLFIGTSNTPVEVIQLQKEGKRRMDTSEFLAGNDL